MEKLLVIDSEDPRKASLVAPVSLSALGLWERRHLQEWVIANPRILGEDVMIVTAEYDRWASYDGASAADRLDILGIDASGRLVVVELKRGVASRDVHLQAITYAAMVAQFEPDSLARAHHDFLIQQGVESDLESARKRLEGHVEDGELNGDILRQPKIVLLAEGFPPQVSNSAVWLSAYRIDIELIRAILWVVADQIVGTFTRVFPTESELALTLGPARQEVVKTLKKVEAKTRAANATQRIISLGRLADDTLLRIAPRHGPSTADSELISAWMDQEEGRRTAYWKNTSSGPIVWAGDGKSYKPTGLAKKLFTEATGKPAGAYQGTTWFSVESGALSTKGDPVPDLVGLTLDQVVPAEDFETEIDVES